MRQPALQPWVTLWEKWFLHSEQSFEPASVRNMTPGVTGSSGVPAYVAPGVVESLLILDTEDEPSCPLVLGIVNEL